jgi:hypothetical protein
MSAQSSADSPSEPASENPTSTPPDPGETPQLPTRVDVLLEQYKLALEMAVHMSNKRQDANNFYIGLVSSFGGLYALLEKAPASFTRSAWDNVLPILAVCWCVAWWLTLRQYRRVNMAKWQVIYGLEAQLPGDKPFKLEGDLLELESRKGKKDKSKKDQSKEEPSPGTFAFTRIEKTVPILVGLIFLLLAVRPLLDLFFNTLAPGSSPELR